MAKKKIEGVQVVATRIDKLHRLKRLVRIGWSLADAPPLSASPERSLAQEIDRHIDELRPWSNHAALVHRLQFLILRTEFEFSFGRKRLAAGELMQLVSDEGLLTQLLRKSSGELFTFSTPEDDENLLRQKLWALMSVAFYVDHSAGRIRPAIATLHSVKTIVDSELTPLARRARKDPAYEPAGTRTQLHLFLAQCYRTQREFSDAQKHFLAAQQQIEARLQRELVAADRHPPEVRLAKRRDQFQSGIISTARVLGGLGRLAVLEGRLSRARQILHSCLTLLLPGGHTPLTKIIESHLMIIERRASAPLTKEWSRAMARLESLQLEFESAGDHDGSRRCAHERARAHLEHAEMLPPDEERAEVLGHADAMVQELQRIATTRDEKGEGHAERFRSLVLRAQIYVLAPQARVDQALEDLQRARQLADAHAQCTLDIAGFDYVNLDLVEVVVHAAAVRAGVSSLTVDDVLRRFDDLRRVARKRHDRLFEVEVVLRTALFQAETGRVQNAQLLRLWNASDGLIENAFLHALSRKAVSETRPVITLADGNLEEALRIAEEALCHWAVTRTNDPALARKRLGINAERLKSVLDRRRERHRAELS